LLLTRRYLSGDQAAYRDGMLIRSNTQGENGAWEIGFRYSTIDPNDRKIEGNEESNETLGK
jgi:phosphate-selective porin